jgi:GNAT superfamily N-acetyltransferase
MFSLNPEVAGRSDGQELWVDVDDVNALYASHLERGAMVVSDIEDKPWGRREYTVCDPNGYHLRFGGDPTHRPRGSGMLPSDIRIERRKPTAEEFHAVAGGAFNYGEASADLLASTWAGVLAEDSNGETIGVVRIMFDAPGWFSIWDVAVLPDWQGQRIGTAMMEAALEIVREVSPGANVYLFTFKHEFYERLGFARESVDLVKV